MKCGDIVFDKETGKVGEVERELYEGVKLKLTHIVVWFGDRPELIRASQFSRLIKFRELDELVFMKDEMVLIAGPAPRI